MSKVIINFEYEIEPINGSSSNHYDVDLYEDDLEKLDFSDVKEDDSKDYVEDLVNYAIDHCKIINENFEDYELIAGSISDEDEFSGTCEITLKSDLTDMDKFIIKSDIESIIGVKVLGQYCGGTIDDVIIELDYSHDARDPEARHVYGTHYNVEGDCYYICNNVNVSFE